MKLGLENERVITSRQLILLRNISSLSVDLQTPCHLVGGAVRDLLLEKQVNDLDIVIEGDAIKFGHALVEKFGGRLTPHQKFKTAIWHLPASFQIEPSFIDLITARSETYERPGALPTITPATIEDDLHRRDFTINAMALRLEPENFGELIDPLNGKKDLEAGVIRILHPRSFVDDPTRIFRAVRYESRYSFQLDPITSSAITTEALATLQSLSGERIRHEIDLILDEQNPLPMLQRLQGFNTFPRIHHRMPSFNMDYADFLEMDAELDIPANKNTMGYILWLIDLTEADIMSIAQRLDFNSDLTYSIWAASQLKKGLPFLIGSKPSEWTFALEKLPLLSIYVVYLISGEGPLLNFLSFWRHIKPRTSGDVLKQHNLPPGPRYAEILTRLRAAWLDGEITNETQEKELLNTLL